MGVLVLMTGFLTRARQDLGQNKTLTYLLLMGVNKDLLKSLGLLMNKALWVLSDVLWLVSVAGWYTEQVFDLAVHRLRVRGSDLLLDGNLVAQLLEWYKVLYLAFMQVRLSAPWVEVHVKYMVDLFRDPGATTTQGILLFLIGDEALKVIVIHAVVIIASVLLDDVQGSLILL
jgi:hypothetical protein